MRPIIVLRWLHVFAEDHEVDCNGYRGRLKLSECCDGYMGCQITNRLAVIAIG